MNQPTIEELKAMTVSELVAMYDRRSVGNHVKVEFLRKEIALREEQEQTQAMLRYTRWITAMTVVVTVATLVNVGAALGWIG